MRAKFGLVAALLLLGFVILLTCRRAHEFDTAPGTPATPVGPSSGACDSLYLFTTSAVDPDSDSVAYRFDWGDGEVSDWTRFVASGESAGAEHVWYHARACSVKAQAKDVHGALSDWSGAYAMELRSGPRFADSVVARIEVGMSPTGVAALPSGEYVYVACQDDGAVWVIQTSDNTVVARILVGWSPWSVAATPDGQYVYATNFYGGTVSVIRTSDNQVVDTIGVGVGVSEIAVLPNGKFAYACQQGEVDKVHVISTDSNAVVATVEPGSWPVGICATPNSEYVAVACCGGGRVVFVRTQDNAIVGDMSVGDSPWGVAADPQGDRVYFSIECDHNWGAAGIGSITVPDFKVADTMALLGYEDFPQAVAMSPGGRYMYVVFEDPMYSQVTVVEPRRNRIVGYVFDNGAYPGPYGITCLPDGRVYVANWEDETVTVLGFSGGTARNTHFRPYRGER